MKRDAWRFSFCTSLQWRPTSGAKAVIRANPTTALGTKVHGLWSPVRKSGRRTLSTDLGDPGINGLIQVYLRCTKRTSQIGSHDQDHSNPNQNRSNTQNMPPTNYPPTKLPNSSLNSSALTGPMCT